MSPIRIAACSDEADALSLPAFWAPLLRQTLYITNENLISHRSVSPRIHICVVQLHIGTLDHATATCSHCAASSLRPWPRAYGHQACTQVLRVPVKNAPDRSPHACGHTASRCHPPEPGRQHPAGQRRRSTMTMTNPARARRERRTQSKAFRVSTCDGDATSSGRVCRQPTKWRAGGFGGAVRLRPALGLFAMQ